MAQYAHLSIYKTTYEFLVYYSHLFTYFQKEYRYTLGEKLLNLTLEFMVLIYKSNDARTNTERAKILTVMGEKIQHINIILRLCCSLKNISREKYLNCCRFVQDIEKQLAGWLNYTITNETRTTIREYCKYKMVLVK